jgi:outer membrane protein OmpA-like peptidoglycan-associated protein
VSAAKTGKKAPAKPIASQPVARKIQPENSKPVKKQEEIAQAGIFPVSGNKADPPVEHLDPVVAMESVRSVAPRFVFFEQGQSNLEPETLGELDRLAALLVKYPSVRITLTGHTDNAGDFLLNVALSKDRARAVADYLTLKGVSPERIQWKGLGGVYPVSPNTTEANRQKNRRVEFIWQ